MFYFILFFPGLGFFFAVGAVLEFEYLKRKKEVESTYIVVMYITSAIDDVSNLCHHTQHLIYLVLSLCLLYLNVTDLIFFY